MSTEEMSTEEMGSEEVSSEEASTGNEVQMVKMAVNQEVCIGAGQCEMLEEETFLVDEDTVVADVIGTGMLPLDRAQRVIETCPTQAISIAEPAEEAEEEEAEETVRSRVEEPIGDGSRPAGDAEPLGDGSRPAEESD